MVASFLSQYGAFSSHLVLKSLGVVFLSCFLHLGVSADGVGKDYIVSSTRRLAALHNRPSGGVDEKGVGEQVIGNVMERLSGFGADGSILQESRSTLTAEKEQGHTPQVMGDSARDVKAVTSINALAKVLLAELFSKLKHNVIQTTTTTLTPIITTTSSTTTTGISTSTTSTPVTTTTTSEDTTTSSTTTTTTSNSTSSTPVTTTTTSENTTTSSTTTTTTSNSTSSTPATTSEATTTSSTTTTTTSTSTTSTPVTTTTTSEDTTTSSTTTTETSTSTSSTEETTSSESTASSNTVLM